MQVLKKAVTISGDSVTWGSLLGTENYVYDAYDRLIRTIRTDGSYNLIGESRWTLDNNDNVTALTSRYVVNGTLKTRIYNYTYNADQQPTQTTYSTIKETIGYDGFGRRSEKDVYRSDVLRLQTQYAYRDVDSTYTTEQIATLTHTYNNTTLTHAYTYDANGNILTDTVNGDTIEYTYDALNRLTWEKNAAAELAWQYTYDLGGNILSKTEYTYVNGITSNPQMITYTYGDSQWPDLLTSWNNQSITYDGIGNPTNYMGSTMEWQGGRQLKGMTSGNNILSFAYNDSGLRTEKTITHANSGLSETKQYIWNGSRLVAEIGPEYSFYFHYNGAGEMIGFTYRVEDNGSGSPDEAEHIFVKNQQGDVEKVLRPWDQAVVAEYSYDAWGNLLDWSGPLAERNPIRYRGYYYDTETGFYYLQSRYYDPQTGRFINADGYVTTGQGLMSYNMFAYCMDNPVNYLDPNGTEAVTVATSLYFIVLVIISAITAISAVEMSESITKEMAERKRKNDGAIYSVYFLGDEKGNVVYVGRVKTKNKEERMAYHKRNRGLEPINMVDGLTYEQARGLEEIGMIECNTLTNRFPGNIIHGVGPENINGDLYMFDAINYIRNHIEDAWLNLIR